MSDPMNRVADAVRNSKLRKGVAPGIETIDIPEPPKPAFKVEKGKRSFKDIFKVTPVRDHNSSVFKPEDWSVVVRGMIPIGIDGYIWQSALEAFHVAMEENEPVVITGPTGSGKTSMVENYCAVTGRPFVRMSMRGDIETSALLGMTIAHEGSTKWADGAVTQAVRYGGTVLIDEYDYTPPEIMYALQWLLEDNPRLLLSDKAGELADTMIDVHKEFRLVFAGNTKGQGDMTGEFPGAQVQSQATMDRCLTSLQMDYMPEVDEKRIVKSKVPEITEAQTTDLMKLVGLLRIAYSQGSLSSGVSPRTEVSIAKKWMYWDDPLTAFKLAYMNKLEEDERKVAQDAFVRVFGSK